MCWPTEQKREHTSAWPHRKLGLSVVQCSDGYAIEIVYFTQFQWHEANVLDNWQLAVLPHADRTQTRYLGEATRGPDAPADVQGRLETCWCNPERQKPSYYSYFVRRPKLDTLEADRQSKVKRVNKPNRGPLCLFWVPPWGLHLSPVTNIHIIDRVLYCSLFAG